MDEASLSPFLEALVDKLASPILEGIALLSGQCKDIEKLRSILSTILVMLEDVEGRQLKDEEMQNCLAKLKDATYDADGILDQFTTEAIRRLGTQGQVIKKVGYFFSVSNPVEFHLCMAHEMREIRDRSDATAGEESKFHFREGVQFLKTKGREKSNSLKIESDAYGRREDKGWIVKILLNVGNEEEVLIILVIGMGGSGKTTLAQLIYNDVRLDVHFELRTWVCVFDDFYVVMLSKSIIEFDRIFRGQLPDLHLSNKLLGKDNKKIQTLLF